ncbi:NAD(P)-dependent oxidoreductase [Gemmata sp. JC717]|uniref:NAD-dependent epimerase/dehydratase family protein n=1 Tax=Gemmata algarum TaxID=2975278 RepID=UPI0021BA56E5|nr:NAD(P)-dependent oxidoreductase [Gemmata algarum]MDY3554634.1 NAD(P)-dependent oxidoreductase [Gemmata algarum]
MNRLLITGATGFIGAPAVRAARGHFEVHATARAPRAPVPEGVRFHRCDILNAAEAERLVADVRPTHLLHLAWVATPGVYWTTPENHRWAEASKRLLSAFVRHGGRRAVVTGSCAEYDWAAAGACRETDPPARPHTTYGRCKLAFGRWAEALGAARGVSVARARLFFLYGPHEHPARLVPSVARALLAGAPAACSAGTQVRDFLHVDDAADALVALTRAELTGAVNVGSGTPVAVRDVIGRVAAACGRPELVRLGERDTPATEPPLLVADVTRLRDELGWRPRIDLGTGLDETVGWWRANRAA